MQIEMTPNGVGSAVHELLKSGMPLPDAYQSVSASLRKRDKAFLESELVDYLVRTAEQDVWHRRRPLALNGAEEGHNVDETHGSVAPSARSLLKAHETDFQFFVPGVGRKRFGDCTGSELMKVQHYWHSWGRTLITKARQIKELYEEMAEKGAKTVDDLKLERGSPMLTGLV